MALSDEKMRMCAQKLMLCRMKLLNTKGFFGLLLMHMVYTLDEKCETVKTDGVRIHFNPQFLLSLSDKELEYVLLHEVLHVALRHTQRRGELKKEEYDRACDIIVNSNILLENLQNKSSITLKGEVGENKAPDGKDGYKCSVEELYYMLLRVKPPQKADGGDDDEGEGMEDTEDEGKGQGKGKGNRKGKGTGTGTGRKTKKSGGDGGDEKGDGDGEKEDNGKEKGEEQSENKSLKGWDDHSEWNKGEDDGTDEWEKRIIDAMNAVRIREGSDKRGTIPLFAQRIFDELTKPKTDWRTILNDFVQEEICDYSFSPPDRRFDDSPFFLPDFNEKEEKVKDILFMIDTSGSMSDEDVKAAYSEIKGAIDQFNGKIEGHLGFFDASVVPPKPFCDEEEFKIIRPYGGGGTSFDIIFEYVKKKMEEIQLVSIVILTDGYAPFPPEECAMDIPVLWMINNEEVTPPWGRVARI